MDALELLRLNLCSPMVLGFALGAAGAFLKSDLRLPEAVHSALGSYLLLAIGMKGGVELARADPAALALPAAATLLAGTLVPLACFHVLRRLGRFSAIDAAAVAAHYGSVSVVTFTAATAFVEARGLSSEGYLSALVVFLEIPGILVGLALARSGRGGSSRSTLHEVLTGKSNLLLAGGVLIGAAAGAEGFASVGAFFVDPFRGALTLFLVDMGALAASRLRDLRRAGAFLAVFALAAPVANGLLGAFLGTCAGLTTGGVTVFAAMVASASYIAAPIAVRLALPEANPTLYLTSSLGITFPFNLAIGIPLYHELALLLA
jgi:hypothetical protein